MNELYELKDLRIYLEPENYDAHIEDILDIRKRLKQTCKNLDLITFTEQAGGIWLGGCYPGNGFECIKVKIEFDWSNADEAVQEFIKTWNPEGQKFWDSFIEEGEKYGWE